MRGTCKQLRTIHVNAYMVQVSCYVASASVAAPGSVLLAAQPQTIQSASCCQLCPCPSLVHPCRFRRSPCKLQAASLAVP